MSCTDKLAQRIKNLKVIIKVKQKYTKESVDTNKKYNHLTINKYTII